MNKYQNSEYQKAIQGIIGKLFDWGIYQRDLSKDLTSNRQEA